MKIKDNINKDLETYKSYAKNRELVIDELPGLYKNYFSIIYISINVLMKVNKFNHISKNETLFRIKLVENLLKTVDLINIKHFKDTDKCFRSVIEAYFKYILEVKRHQIFIENKKRGIFKVDDDMKKLKSVSTSQKIGRLTSFTRNYFKDEFPDIEILYAFYGDLSGSVHISETYTEPLYLLQYEEIQFSEITKNISKYKQILHIIIMNIIDKLEEIYKTMVISREDFAYLQKLFDN
ncbi:hypothetical protein [Staphylococcus xylosus]|uniref:hypothetical protein n=1 Tax=Staphylococcus xylosus TaxID=1288 RepID=UPI002DB9B65E|nr:hypothetical protein [Staphylococcus xylosus]MEB6229022.1 hypothetical protein [Staphylococcus xylosus]